MALQQLLQKQITIIRIIGENKTVGGFQRFCHIFRQIACENDTIIDYNVNDCLSGCLKQTTSKFFASFL